MKGLDKRQTNKKSILYSFLLFGEFFSSLNCFLLTSFYCSFSLQEAALKETRLNFHFEEDTVTTFGSRSGASSLSCLHLLLSSQR